MDKLLAAVFSENGLIALLFLLTLYWVYWLAKSFLNRYLKLQNEHNVHFLEKFEKMVSNIWDLSWSIILWNQNHSKEHKDIMIFLDWKHKQNQVDHKQLNDSIKLTHDSVKKLHDIISNTNKNENN